MTDILNQVNWADHKEIRIPPGIYAAKVKSCELVTDEDSGMIRLLWTFDDITWTNPEDGTTIENDSILDSQLVYRAGDEDLRTKDNKQTYLNLWMTFIKERFQRGFNVTIPRELTLRDGLIHAANQVAGLPCEITIDEREDNNGVRRTNVTKVIAR